MKKYKIYWSIFNLFSDSQSEVVKLQTLFKGLTAIIATSTWYVTDVESTLYVGIGGYVLDSLIACFYFELIKDEKTKS